MMASYFSRPGTISQDCDSVSMPRPVWLSEDFLNSSSEPHIRLIAVIADA